MKHFFIRVWKPLSSRHVLKTLRGKPERERKVTPFVVFFLDFSLEVSLAFRTNKILPLF